MLGRLRRAPPPPHATAPMCSGQDWTALVAVALLAAGLARRRDGATGLATAAAAALPAVLGLWCCERPPVGNDNNDQALSLLWSALSLSFIAVLCAAMLGVRDKVCDSDVERASNDALSLLVSCAPAGHAAIFWLRKGPAGFALVVIAGQVVCCVSVLH